MSLLHTFRVLPYRLNMYDSDHFVERDFADFLQAAQEGYYHMSQGWIAVFSITNRLTLRTFYCTKEDNLWYHTER